MTGAVKEQHSLYTDVADHIYNLPLGSPELFPGNSSNSFQFFCAVLPSIPKKHIHCDSRNLVQSILHCLVMRIRALLQNIHVLQHHLDNGPQWLSLQKMLASARFNGQVNIHGTGCTILKIQSEIAKVQWGEKDFVDMRKILYLTLSSHDGRVRQFYLNI